MGKKGRRNPATYICAEQRAFGTNSYRTIWPGERGEIKSLPTNTHRMHSPILISTYTSYMCLVNSLSMRDCTWLIVSMSVTLGLIAELAEPAGVDFREFQRYSSRLQLYGNGQTYTFLSSSLAMTIDKVNWSALAETKAKVTSTWKSCLHGFPRTTAAWVKPSSERRSRRPCIGALFACSSRKTCNSRCMFRRCIVFVPFCQNKVSPGKESAGELESFSPENWSDRWEQWSPWGLKIRAIQP